MSRELTIKLNQILYQRSKNWRESRPNTGILRSLNRKSDDGDSEKTFDKYLKDHIKTSNNTINIRGLFRVPDVSGGERLIINAEEENTTPPQREQKEQVPMVEIDETNLDLPPQDNPLVPHPRAINYHHFRRPSRVEPSETEYEEGTITKYKTHPTKTKTNLTSAEMMNMIMDLEYRKDIPEEVKNRKIFDLHEHFDAEADYKLDENPLSLNDYVNYVKDNPSKTVAIMDPKTGYPKFVLKYGEGMVKLYDNEDTISKFYDYTGKPEDERIPKEYYGKFIPGKVDEIRYQRHDVDINFERLPKDVLHIINIDYDDDDDPDKGGEKILRKKSEIEEEEKEGKISIPYLGKPKDDGNDDEDKGMNIEHPKTSDEYRSEIAMLESEKDKVEIPELADINSKLVKKLKEMQEELDFIKGVDYSRDKEIQELREIYDQQLKDIENMGYTVRELNEERKRIYDEHKGKIEAMELLHNKAKTESQREMENFRKKYDNQIEELKGQLRNKNNEIQDLYKDNFSKDERIENLEAELRTITDKYYKKERELNTEIVRLNELLQQQDVQYQSTKAKEINDLNLIIQKLQGEKNELLIDKQQKQEEIHNLKSMLTESMTAAEKNQERLIKEKEDEANMKQNKLMAEKEIETRNVIQGLETRLNQMEENYKQRMSQYKKDVSTEALRLAGQITKEKDEEIQQLTEELNQYKYKQGESLSQLGGMIQSLGNITEGVMEEELPPKAYPGSLNIEEKKEHVMQTRSQGPVSFGEEIRREIVDEHGNIIWKGTEHVLAGKQYTSAEYVFNLIKPAKTKEISNFKAAYQLADKHKRIFNNTEIFVKDAINILNKELGGDKYKVAIFMDSLINSAKANNINILKGFEEKFTKDYAGYLKK